VGGLITLDALLVFAGIATASAVRSHFVEPGQYLAEIAASYDVRDSGGEGDWKRLCDANPEIQNPNLIYPGQQVRIPDPSEQLLDRPQCELPAPVVAEASGTDPRAVTSVVEPQARPGATDRLQAGSASDYDLARLRGCESNGYADKRNRTYRGGYQFDLPTWQSVGGSGDPADAPPEEQDRRARMLQAREGWAPWPECRVTLGLR
jgi:hypothetical protein